MSIRVTVELRPYGTGDPERIAVLEIGNRDPSGQTCDYDYRFGAPAPDGAHVIFTPWYRLRGHDRRQGVWVLIGQILARRAASMAAARRRPRTRRRVASSGTITPASGRASNRSIWSISQRKRVRSSSVSLSDEG